MAKRAAGKIMSDFAMISGKVEHYSDGWRIGGHGRAYTTRKGALAAQRRAMKRREREHSFPTRDLYDTRDNEARALDLIESFAAVLPE